MVRHRLARIARARLPRLALVTLAAVGSAGCTTFSDNGAPARVDEVEMSVDELTDRLVGVASAADPTRPALADDGRADGDATRQAVTDWIRLQILVASDIGQQYTADPSAVGVTCLDVAIANGLEDAESIKARVDGGEPWDDVVAPIEAAIGYESKQPCQPLQAYAEQLGPEITDTLAALKPGDAPEIIDADGDYAVIRIQELPDVDSVSFLTAVQGIQPDVVDQLLASAAEADVYVDPRIGAFDLPTIDVVPVN